MGDDWEDEVADAMAAAPASGFDEVASADVPELYSGISIIVCVNKQKNVKA